MFTQTNYCIYLTETTVSEYIEKSNHSAESAFMKRTRSVIELKARVLTVDISQAN